MFFTDVEPKPDQAVLWGRGGFQLRQDHAAWSTLAWAAAQRRHRRRRAASAKATASGAEDAGNAVRAGMIEKAAGRTAESRAAVTRALAINPKFDRNQEARKFLSGARR